MVLWRLEIKLSRESGEDFHCNTHDSRFSQYLLSFNINFKLHLGLLFVFLPNLQFLSFSCPFPRPTCPSVPRPNFPWNWNVTDLPVFCLFFFLFWFLEYSRAFSYWHGVLLGNAMDICTLNLVRFWIREPTEMHIDTLHPAFLFKSVHVAPNSHNSVFLIVCWEVNSELVLLF